MKNSNEKAYFLQRLLAFLIDFVLISTISSFLTIPFTNSDNVEKLNKEANEIVEKYANQEIDIETYFNQAQDISYDLSRESGVASVIEIIVLILYFVVFQIYRNGQTIGKECLKIRVVKSDGSDLTMNGMLVRALINDFILSNIFVVIIMLFSRDVYFYGSLIIVIFQYIMIFISIIMVAFSREGKSLADYLTNTKVINIGRK